MTFSRKTSTTLSLATILLALVTVSAARTVRAADEVEERRAKERLKVDIRVGKDQARIEYRLESVISETERLRREIYTPEKAASEVLAENLAKRLGSVESRTAKLILRSSLELGSAARGYQVGFRNPIYTKELIHGEKLADILKVLGPQIHEGTNLIATKSSSIVEQSRAIGMRRLVWDGTIRGKSEGEAVVLIVEGEQLVNLLFADRRNPPSIRYKTLDDKEIRHAVKIIFEER